MTDLFMRRPQLTDLPTIPFWPDGRSLRPYEAGDTLGLAAVLAAAFPGESDPWTAERVKQELVDDETVQTIWLVKDGSHPIATASSRLLPEKYPQSGYVHWVAADPSYAGQRLGYIITLAVLHEFVRIGCRDAVLETQEFRIPAIKTYLKLGFQPEYRQPEDARIWAGLLARYL